MTMRRCSIAVAGSVLLGGCHMFSSNVESCHKPQEYQFAASVAPLKVPEGMDAPNVQGALVIPAAEYTPPPPGPRDPCLDEPPRYKPPQAAKPGAPGAADAAQAPAATPAPAPAPTPAPGAAPP
jgi:uncharacterized lipoprotein